MPKVDAPELVITVGTVADIQRDGIELMREHYEESASYKDLAPLEVMWERFEALEARGQLLVLLVYEGERLIGYSVAELAVGLPSSRALTFGQSAAIMVAKNRRRRGLGMRLMNETEMRAKAWGCDLFIWHTPEKGRLGALEAMLRRNHEPYGLLFARRL
jgi:GNAT superfamily N-acetyltransferase